VNVSTEINVIIPRLKGSRLKYRNSLENDLLRNSIPISIVINGINKNNTSPPGKGDNSKAAKL
jgi:hypothetical protein